MSSPVLTCTINMLSWVSGDYGGDTDSFHASMWDEERQNRQMIHFEFADESDVDVSIADLQNYFNVKEINCGMKYLLNLCL